MKNKNLKDSYGLHLRIGFLSAMVLLIAGFLGFPSYDLRPYVPAVEAVPDTTELVDIVLPPETIPPPIPRPAVPVEAETDEEVEIATIPSMDSLFRTLTGDGGHLPAPDSFIPYDEPPRPVKIVKPKYPDIARMAGIEGDVLLYLLIDTEGRVLDVMVIEPFIAACDSSAVEAARRFLFSPALQNDRPVTVWAAYWVKFRLRN